MSYSSELNDAYEEAIGLDVEDNGRIWIENHARDVRPHPDRVVTIRCEWCNRALPVAYLRAGEDRFRWRNSVITIDRWSRLRAGRKALLWQDCPSCDQETPWKAGPIDTLEEDR